jgi:hypothetical protein
MNLRMNALRFTRWRWMLAGLAAGALLSFLWRGADPAEGLRSLSSAQFEKELMGAPLKSGAPFIRDVLVYPAADGANLVTFQRLVPAREGMTYVPACVIASIPYHAGSDATIGAFLDRTAAKHPGAGYRYAWWATPWLSYAFWIGSALLVIGGGCPLLIGMAKQRKIQSAANGSPQASAAPKREPEPIETCSPIDPPAMPIAPLPPTDPIQPLPEPIAETKDFRGEFYPVEQPQPKHLPTP